MPAPASVVLMARRIAGAIRQFAASEGFAPGDYAVVGSYDDAAEHIRLTVGTDRPVDDKRWHREIRGAIKAAFPDDRFLLQHIGLVVRQFPRIDDVYWDAALGEGEVDITDLLDRVPV